jgi:ATP-dependent DNA ligase
LRRATGRGEARGWLRHPAYSDGIEGLAGRLPILWRGTVLDRELTTGRFRTTLAAATGSPTFGPSLRLVVFDVPILAGVDLRPLPWQERRERLELLAQAFDVPFELSPLVDPSTDLAEQMIDGRA